MVIVKNLLSTDERKEMADILNDGNRKADKIFYKIIIKIRCFFGGVYLSLQF